jgi:hypothetical protein
MLKSYHVQLHSDEDNKVVFEAQVYANDTGEAVEKIKKHLQSTGCNSILASYQRYSSVEIDRRCNPNLPLIE